MSEYDNLLDQARKAAKESADYYVPELYYAFLKENPNITPEEARERVEKDCKKIWSKRTVVHALPPEAKNPVKQKAGMQAHKHKRKQESAADSAAEMTDPGGEKKLVSVTAGGYEELEDADRTNGGDGDAAKNGPNHSISDANSLPVGEPPSIADVSENWKSSNRGDSMVLEFSIPDEQIDSYRKTRGVQDNWAKVTKIRITVDRRTEKVLAFQLGDSAQGDNPY